MEQYRVLAKYKSYGPDGQKRVYHASDVDHTGPSVSVGEFHQGKRPTAPPPARPRGEVRLYDPAEELEIERQVASQRPRRASLTGLECPHCERITCRCGVPAVPNTTEEALKLQQARRQR